MQAEERAREYRHTALFAITALASAAISYLWLRPVRSQGFAEKADPVTKYKEAVQRADALDEDERSDLADYGRTLLLTHGRKTKRVIVFLHGYSNSPAQFALLGERFYARGYNVLIPRLPHHGFRDRMTTALTCLTAEEMTLLADYVVDIARGLGTHVTLVGLSAGGVLAAWAAQHRDDLESVVLIDPSFSYKAIPEIIVRPIMNLSLLLPDSFAWWDAGKKENGHTAYSYPRYSKRGLAEFLRLGLALKAKSARHAPAAKAMLVVTNGNDNAADNRMTTTMIKNWRRAGAATIETYEFAKSLQLDHDMIDPTQRDEHIELVYPKLLELIDR